MVSLDIFAHGGDEQRLAVWALKIPCPGIQHHCRPDTSHCRCRGKHNQGDSRRRRQLHIGGNDNQRTHGDDGNQAAHHGQYHSSLVFFVFFHQIHHIFLRFLLILQLRYPFAGEQVVDGNLQNSAQRQHQGHLRQPLATLPFGNGFIADGKCVGKLPLGQVFFFSGIGYEFSDFNLIHRFSLLSAAIVSGEG